ncbi:sulfotransferase 1 family member D1-like [Haematobia irritans]|uniref:sulfotransferase 1 family member D1-like n=1 Tax=Haematobia irritans TaxID=7368 RepID=UPI003F4F66C4
MTDGEKLYISQPINTAICKARSHFPLKRYSSCGHEVPLKKNWLTNWCTMPALFDSIAEDILNYDVRPDDIFVLTFMKSGTTWMQETVWLLMNNLDYEQAKTLPLTTRSPFLEISGWSPFEPNALELSKLQASPRILKSHLHPNLLPRELWTQKPKIIYVARNCKDVIVSSYHFVKNLGLWCGESMEDYVTDFINNNISNTAYWTHIVDFWMMRQEPNILYVTYEEMKKNLKGVIEKLCDFLERPQLNAEEMEELLKHLSFDSMKANKQTNMTSGLKESTPFVKGEFEFMRRGIVGSYKDELTPELQTKIDNWSREFLAQHDLTEEMLFNL